MGTDLQKACVACDAKLDWRRSPNSPLGYTHDHKCDESKTRRRDAVMANGREPVADRRTTRQRLSEGFAMIHGRSPV